MPGRPWWDGPPPVLCPRCLGARFVRAGLYTARLRACPLCDAVGLVTATLGAAYLIATDGALWRVWRHLT